MGSMNFEELDVGGDTDVWGEQLNTNLGLAEEHDHTTGKGVRIPTAGLNINAALTFAGYNATNIGAAGFVSAGLAHADAPSGSLRKDSSSGELVWKTAGGTSVQLTSGNSLNVGLVGGITGDYSSASPTPTVRYVDATKTYELTSVASPTTYGKVKCSDLSLLEPTSGISNAVTLKSPTSLAASYSLTMPAALPGSTSFLSLDSSGNIAAGKVIPSNPAGLAYVQMTSAGVFQTSTGQGRVFSFSDLAGDASGNWARIDTWGSRRCNAAGSQTLSRILEGLQVGARIVSVAVRCQGTTNRVLGLSLKKTSDWGSASSISGATGSSSGNTIQTVTLTPSSPETVVAHTAYILEINAPTGNTDSVYAYSFTVTVDYGT